MCWWGGKEEMEGSPDSPPRGASLSLDLLINCRGKGIPLYQPTNKIGTSASRIKDVLPYK